MVDAHITNTHTPPAPYYRCYYSHNIKQHGLYKIYPQPTLPQLPMEECHICKFKYCQSSATQPPLPKCCIKRCNKKYCIGCIRDKFDTSFQEAMYKPDTWICYSCQNLCACLVCKGIGSDKKAAKKKGLIGSSSKQEAKLDNDKELVVEDYYTPQQLNSVAPFLRKSYQRRNNLFKLMANSEPIEMPTKAKQPEKVEEVSKQEERGTKRIKQQLIRKTLKEYCDDQNDIELIE